MANDFRGSKLGPAARPFEDVRRTAREVTSAMWSLMKPAVRGVAYAIMPRVANAWAELRCANRRRRGPTSTDRAIARFLGGKAPVITAGPFAGLKYINVAVGSGLIAKLTGHYEEELTPVIEHIISSGVRGIVDIGCAEGYYAVGLASRLARTRVVAFESEPRARFLCRELARLNGVSGRLTILGTCSRRALKRVVQTGWTVISDCEGGEVHLLDPDRIPALRRCAILVELHDFAVSGASNLVRQRFCRTHDIRLISSVPRDPASDVRLAGYPAAERAAAVDEGRPGPMQWAWMTPRTVAMRPTGII